MWLIVLLVIAALTAFGWLTYKHGWSAAAAAVVALVTAVSAAVLNFVHVF